MKSCPSCQRLFPDDAGFCPEDGVELRRATEVPLAHDETDPRVGSIVCQRYQVRRVVADGGMGRVYEALDTVDRARVALKVLHLDVVRDSVSVERFKREFEVSQLLPHEHIVDVRDFQLAPDGTHVLAMEFLDGEELRNLLKREKYVAPWRLVRIMSQLAIGLDEAHLRKLVHRDLKPDNVFLCGTREGDIVKVLDFGSVKDKNIQAKKLTVLGTTIGSPYYMSPEQAQALDTLDARADVWSLAAIAYECITGTVPFGGSQAHTILLNILSKDPLPPSEVGTESPFPIPPTIDEWIETGLAKAPGHRPASVGALADALGHAYGLEGEHASWATTPESELRARIERGLLAGPKRAQKPQAPAEAVAAMDDVFAASREQTAAGAIQDDIVMGVPQGPPRWLVPVLVGVVALGVGGAIAFFASR